MAEQNGNWARTLLAVLIGLAGAAAVAISVPYNNFKYGNSLMADAQLPVFSCVIAVVIIFGLNPLLHLVLPSLSMRKRELVLVFGMILVAAVPTSTGLHRGLPYALTGIAEGVSRDKALADKFEVLDPRPSLFPDKLAYESEPKVATDFRDELDPQEPVPWGAWMKPLFAWSGFYVPWIVMMVGLAVIVLPQWRDNERVQFPLLTVQQALIEKEDGAAFPSILRSGAFWTGLLVIFVGWHLPGGLNKHFPGTFPVMPGNWGIMDCCQEGILRNTPWWLQFGTIFFIFVGMGFFMPSRIGFSLWAMQIIYGIIIILGMAIAPPFNYGPVVSMHQNGAFIAFPLVAIWLGRRHWARVFRAVFGLGKSEGAEERLRDRIGGMAFLVGCAGVFAWLCWVRVNPVWAAGLVVLAVLFTVAILRVVAETGIPFIAGEPAQMTALLGFIPTAWRTAAAMYFSGVLANFATWSNRICAASVVLHGLGLDRRASPRRHVRLAGALCLVLLLAALVSGGAHLVMNYRNPTNVSGVQINTFGESGFRSTPEGLLSAFIAKRDMPASLFHVLTGVALVLVLQWLCMRCPWWPLHPLPLLFVTGFYAQQLATSVFLGWLAKVLILKYGGSRLYSRAVPFFLGVIMADLFAVVFWTLIGLIVSALTGKPFIGYGVQSGVI